MNKKVLELTMALFLLIGAYYLARAGAQITSGKIQEYSYRIVIDAGHGGPDPGKIGIHGELEKDINLQIALLLKEQLEQNNIEVYLLRDKDKDLADEQCSNRKAQDLKRRCEQIHEIGPDCVISIHQNSYSQEAAHGAQVFYYEDSEEARKLAESIQDSFQKNLDVENIRKAKGDRSYYLLKKTDSITVIVECGFLSNEKESVILTDRSYQVRVADAICKGILPYLEQRERRENSI